MGKQSKDDQDNHSNQLNPNNDAYWSSRNSTDDKSSDNRNDDKNNDPDDDLYSADGWSSEDY